MYSYYIVLGNSTMKWWYRLATNGWPLYNRQCIITFWQLYGAIIGLNFTLINIVPFQASPVGAMDVAARTNRGSTPKWQIMLNGLIPKLEGIKSLSWQCFNAQESYKDCGTKL